MNSLINLFARRPVTVIMIISAVLIGAVFSLFSLPVNRLPDISVPRVTVETIYPGMSANEVRSLVTIPLEDSLSPVKGLEKIRSVSRDYRSLLSLDFRWGTDPMTAAVLVREAIDAVYPSLPEGLQKPSVSAGDSAVPHAIIAVRSHNENSNLQNASFARKLAEYELRARIRRIDGAGSIVLVGGEIQEEKLFLDIQKLAALGFSPSDFAGILARETVDIPAGNAKEGNMELIVVSSGRPESVYDLSNIILPVLGGFAVKDAGKLESSSARRESAFVYDGNDAVAMEVYRRPGSDPAKLSRDIKKIIKEASLSFSDDVLIDIIYDSAPSITSSITSLLISASIAIAAIITVLFFFIRNLKASLLASLSIPFSAASGISALFILGKSLNSMSLGGLAMGIGLVSDISVIVLDLLYRSQGKNTDIPSSKEITDKVYAIAGSSAASTLTTIAVFLPVIFLPGMIGSLFGDIAVSLIVSVAAGWFYAQFCLPSLYLFLYKSGNSGQLNISAAGRSLLNEKYSGKLKYFLHRPKQIFIFASVLILAGIISLFSMKKSFINPDEAEEINISVIFPPGTRLEAIEETGREVSEKISEFNFVKTVFGRAGAEEEDIARRSDIDYIKEELVLRCILNKRVKPEKALAEITAYVNNLYEYLSPVVYFPKDKTGVLLGISGENTFVINGRDREELLERADIFNKSVNNSVTLRPRGKRPELKLYPNREAAAYLSISSAQLAETLFIINEGVTASKLEIEGKEVDVRVTGEDWYNSFDTKGLLEQIPVKTPQGKTVFLGSLCRIEQEEAESSLARLNRNDVFYASIAEPVNSDSEFTWFSRADESVFKRHSNSLVLYVIIVFILLYMTMGVQFESFSLPLILMLTIPFSLSGSALALLITGCRLDSGAVLGLTALFGLVVNNSLILYEISIEKIKEGLPPVSAVYSGARDRFRAILITTLTTVFALAPLIISPVTNSQKSMAAAMLGGLIASAMLSLFAIPPVLAIYFNKRMNLKEAG